MIYRSLVASNVLRARSAHVSFIVRVRTYSTPTDLPVPDKKKVWSSADEAVKDIKSGDVLLSAGMSDIAVHGSSNAEPRLRFRAVRHTWCVGLYSPHTVRLTTAGTDTLIGALANRPDVTMLTAVSNNAGSGMHGLGRLLHSGQLDKMIASYIGG